MDGGASSSSNPYMRRQSNKRTFSDMSASHREPSSGPPHDTHYDSEHSSQRRRLRTDLPRLPVHYPGDGLDFRRPVVSNSAAHTRQESEDRNSMRNRTAVIDLTDEDGAHERSQSSEAPPRSFTMPRGYPHAQRLPRFGRDVIEVESSGESEEEGQSDLSNLPGANYLALPHRRPQRPHLSGLRRPARPPSPPTDMDDIEFLEERPRSRPRSQPRVVARLPSPVPTRGRVVRERTVTPYPAGVGETIDLTEDNDDDIVHLDTRQRPGGQHYGGRLMQRLQGMAGLDGELMAQQQAYDHFNHNHNQQRQAPHGYNQAAAAAAQIAAVQAQRRQMAAHRARANRARPPTAAGAPGLRIAQEMAGLMDYTHAAFDMGIVGGGNQPPTPTYTPPPPPEKGFTRGPEEDEVVVCPNCGDELAMGDSERKQEVWVVKSCGHAYCGECAQNRSRPKTKKGKGKGKEPAYAEEEAASKSLPFKNCVVEGCNKPTSGKTSMIMAYLGC